MKEPPNMTDQTRADFEAHFQLTTRQRMKQHHDGSYIYTDIQAKWEGYLAGVATSAPVGYKLVPIVATREIVRMIEDTIDNQVKASCMVGIMHRMDGDNVWDAALSAAPVAAAAPAAVPQTDLQREIARDAEAFETTLTERPARESSLAYPWGWRYVSNEVQGQFRDWCCRHPK